MNTLSPRDYKQQALPFDDIPFKHQPNHEEHVKIPLRDARAQIHLSQRAFAKRAHIATNTMISAEAGKPIHINTAQIILDTLNLIRDEQGLDPLSMQDIDMVGRDWFHSPEGKAKLSEKNSGTGNPMYGRVGAMKGKHQSPEWIRKRMESRKDTPMSDEARKNFSKAKLGKKQSEEHRKKSAVASLGKRRSDEAKKKYSAAQTAYWAVLSKEERAEQLANWTQAGQAAHPLPKKDTKPELAFEAKLKARGLHLGVDYEKQFKIGSCYVDFYIPSENRVIEIMGCWWHQCPQCGHTQGIPCKKKGIRTAEAIHAHDERRIKYIESKGYSVQVIWAHEL